MSTNWGAAQYSRALDTLGTGVQDRGIQKIYRSKKSFGIPGDFWAPSNFPSLPQGPVTNDIPFLDETSDLFYLNSAGGRRMVVPVKAGQIVKMRIVVQGFATANSVLAGVGGFSLDFHPATTFLPSYGNKPRRDYPVYTTAVSDVSTFSHPFTYDEEYYFQMHSLVDELGVTDISGINRLSISQKNRYAVGVAGNITHRAPFATSCRIYMQKLETEISVLQNMVEFSNSEVLIS